MAVDPRNKKLELHPLIPSVTEPAPLSHAIAQAIQLLATGEASAHQQQMALSFIRDQMSGVIPIFRKDSRDNDFGMGRSFVGQQIVGALKINLAYLIEKENKNGR